MKTNSDGIGRPELTQAEQALVGRPGDLVDEDRVPARPRSASVMFSLRIDRKTFEALSDLAEERGRRFSDVARDALRTYVDRSAEDASHRLLEAIAIKVGVTSETIYPMAAGSHAGRQAKGGREASMAWTDESLDEALGRYERACRQARMKANASHSYWDYAHRFLAWRKGEYRPRGTVGSGRPVAAMATTIDELKEQARAYTQAVEAAGRQQATVDTYFRHAMFFVRWLYGDFIPGSRLEGR